MIVTDRQKRLLQILLEAEEGISLSELEERIGISRRTIYREISLLRPVLDDVGLKLENKKRRLRLLGDEEDVQALAGELQETRGQTEMNADERANALVVLLLLSDEPQKIAGLAIELKVSEATVQSDLNAVAEILRKYQIELVRTKGLGVMVNGSEAQRRRILSGIILSESNDYMFFDYLNQADQAKSGNFFIDLLPKADLLLCWQALKTYQLENFNMETDYQLIELILLFALSIKRLKAGKAAEAESTADSAKYSDYVRQVFAFFKQEGIDLDLPAGEVAFLASQIHAYDYQRVLYPEDEDAVLVNLKIGQFVQDVSEGVQFDFSKNPAFVSRLQKHISGLLQHSVQRLPNVRIETLSQVTMKFPDLFKAIKQAWLENFEDEQLNAAELQLLLLYFANEYGNRSQHRNLSALVICDNGLGTSAILASRLKKEIPEIEAVKTTRVSQLPKIHLEEYDIIFSTLNLPGFPRDYHLVSPLLLGDELKRVRSDVAKYVQKYPAKAKMPKAPRKIAKPQEKLLYLTKMSTFMVTLLTNLDKCEIDNRHLNVEQTLAAVVNELPDWNVIDRGEILYRLKKRLQLAPLGVPHSSVTLLHAKTAAVKESFLGIYDLTKPVEMEAMDHSKIMVSRHILMLAPEENPEDFNVALGMIASMLVMNDQTLQLFSTGSLSNIKDAIARQYLNQVEQQIVPADKGL